MNAPGPPPRHRLGRRGYDGSVGARTLISIPLLALAGALVLAGCVGGLDAVTGPDPNCKDVEVSAVLHLDAGAPRQVWATDIKTAADLHVEVQTTAGWTVDPGPPPTLVDGAGRVVGREGDILRTACYDALTNTYFVGPDDLPGSEASPD